MNADQLLAGYRWAASFVFAMLTIAVQAELRPQSYSTPAYIHFTDQEYHVAADETNVVITLIRTGEFRQSTWVEYIVEGEIITNQESTDFSGRVTFPAGQSTGSISIPIPTGQSGFTLTIRLENAASNAVIVTPAADIRVLSSSVPRLSIESGAGGELLLSWPSGQGEYVLEKSEDLQAGDWKPVTATPILSDGRWKVSEQVQAKKYFYRLRAGEN